MVSVTNLIFAVIVTISTLIIENYAENISGCLSDDDCMRSEVCSKKLCVNGCIPHDCTHANEECFTIDHISRCVCKKEFVRKRNGICESANCTKSSECDFLEHCSSARNEDFKKCQCDNGLKENPYSNPRCVNDESIPSCRSDDNCENGYICYRGKCITICFTTECPENEECIETYGRCDCKNGYRRDSQGQCKRYCTNSNKCGITEECVMIDGINQCGCPDGFIRNTYPPFICRQPCETRKDCPPHHVCSDSKCVQFHDYHPRND